MDWNLLTNSGSDQDLWFAYAFQFFTLSIIEDQVVFTWKGSASSSPDKL